MGFMNNKFIYYEEISESEAYENEIPIDKNKTYYHSTSDKILNQILNQGLCVQTTKQHRRFEVSPVGIFITTYPEISWADFAVEDIGGNQIYFIIKGKDIINSGCNAYPDWIVEQPIIKTLDNIAVHKVTHILLLNCNKCVPVTDYKYFK